MPKFKSKKKKSHKNKKQDHKGKAQDENNSTVKKEEKLTTTVKDPNTSITTTAGNGIPVTVVDLVIDHTDNLNEGLEVKSVAKTDHNEEPTLEITAEEHIQSNDNNSIATAVTSAPVSSKKKRFSFLRKKNRSTSTLDVNSGNSSMDSAKKDGTVQRASSMSQFDRHEHKSKIPRFRSSKKKNNLSASCSNVESTSLVLNPGMDDWRMTGLLNTVEKSNSSVSLNASKNSEKEQPVVALVPQLQQESIKVNSSKPEVIELQKTNKDADNETTPVTPVIKVEIATTSPEAETKPSNEFVQTNIDFEYSAEIHDKQKPIKIDPETEKDGEDDIGSPTLKDASNDAELYELENDERVVSIRKLEDVVRETKISLPKEVTMNDWLVLNLTQREIPSF